ncbi:PREDICTED: metaxin-3-like [Nicrophorus vespilloides]|uniref:Metaxin-3-like n=1 Tax=Nicrophorus vespilloides TaxID=110193 RepID=A0ABM1MHG2_NICVS|nr:PREDICTED: metaxin-3-like [Nicrophorus vespilloides]
MDMIPKNSGADTDIVLYVLEGFNGIPSADPLSSQLIYLIKIHAIKRIQIKTSKFYVNANLPRLECNHSVITHPVLIRNYIENIIRIECCKEESYCKHMNDKYPKEHGRIIAYQNVITNFLEKIALVNGWGSNDNILESTKLYSKGIFFPFKFVFVRHLRNIMDNKMFDLYNYQWKFEVIDKIYEDAAVYLNDFSNTLGDKPFMFGKYPTTLDVYLCSYLAPALLYKYPDNRMEQLIYSCDTNLEVYIKKFVDLYGDLNEGFPKKIEPITDRASIPVMIAAGFFTVSAMMIFAKLHGIFKF